jgi:hypothetical protein
MSFNPDVSSMTSRISSAFYENRNTELILKINGQPIQLNGNTPDEKAGDLVAHIFKSFQDDGTQDVSITLETPAGRTILTIVEKSDNDDVSKLILTNSQGLDSHIIAEYFETGGKPKIQLISKTPEERARDRELNQKPITIEELKNKYNRDSVIVNVPPEISEKLGITVIDFGDGVYKIGFKDGLRLTYSNYLPEEQNSIDFNPNTHRLWIKEEMDGNFGIHIEKRGVTSASTLWYRILPAKSAEEIRQEDAVKEQLRNLPYGEYKLTAYYSERSRYGFTLQVNGLTIEVHKPHPFTVNIITVNGNTVRFSNTDIQQDFPKLSSLFDLASRTGRSVWKETSDNPDLLNLLLNEEYVWNKTFNFNPE